MELRILRIESVDEFGDENVVQCVMRIEGADFTSFAKEIDGEEDYNLDCWLVMLNYNEDYSVFNSAELYYISNDGLVRPDMQLENEQVELLKQFVKDNLNN